MKSNDIYSEVSRPDQPSVLSTAAITGAVSSAGPSTPNRSADNSLLDHQPGSPPSSPVPELKKCSQPQTTIHAHPSPPVTRNSTPNWVVHDDGDDSFASPRIEEHQPRNSPKAIPESDDCSRLHSRNPSAQIPSSPPVARTPPQYWATYSQIPSSPIPSLPIFDQAELSPIGPVSELVDPFTEQLPNAGASISSPKPVPRTTTANHSNDEQTDISQSASVPKLYQLRPPPYRNVPKPVGPRAGQVISTGSPIQSRFPAPRMLDTLYRPIGNIDTVSNTNQSTAKHTAQLPQDDEDVPLDDLPAYSDISSTENVSEPAEMSTLTSEINVLGRNISDSIRERAQTDIQIRGIVHKRRVLKKTINDMIEKRDGLMELLKQKESDIAERKRQEDGYESGLDEIF